MLLPGIDNMYPRLISRGRTLRACYALALRTAMLRDARYRHRLCYATCDTDIGYAAIRDARGLCHDPASLPPALPSSYLALLPSSDLALPSPTCQRPRDSNRLCLCSSRDQQVRITQNASEHRDANVEMCQNAFG
eukprot:2204852-Rhodomonas_salina.3